MMKILLINPPGWQKGSTNLGLCYLAGNLIKNGHDVVIFDLNANNMSSETISRKVENYAPDVIGFSIKTATAKEAFLISKKIMEHYTKAVHVAGGPHITLAYKETLLNNYNISYCFLGESDISFISFINKLENKQSIENIPGIAYLKNKNVVATSRENIENLDVLSYPSLKSIENFDFSEFRYPIITSRGCPYLCTYCCVGIISSRKWRPRTAENVINELKYVKEKFKINSFEILDDNFSFDLNRAKEFCKLLIKSKLRLKWYCHNGVRADKVDLELAKLMKKAGCTSIALGIESGNIAVFNSIKKGERLESIVKAVNYIKMAKMKVVGYFIIGLPGDSLTGIKKTIKFQQNLCLDNYVYGILNPYPYTEVYEKIKQNGKILIDIKESSHFSENITIPFELPKFPKEDMKKAYYLCKYQKLYKAIELTEKASCISNTKILYIDFSDNSNFVQNFAYLETGYNLDIFCSSWKNPNYFNNKNNININNLRAFKLSTSTFENLKNILKILNKYRQHNYDIVFYNLKSHAKLFLLVFCIIHPKKLYLETDSGERIFTIKNKEIKNYFVIKLLKKIVSIPFFIISILVTLLLQFLYYIFIIFIYFERNNKTFDISNSINNNNN